MEHLRQARQGHGQAINLVGDAVVDRIATNRAVSNVVDSALLLRAVVPDATIDSPVKSAGGKFIIDLEKEDAA